MLTAARPRWGLHSCLELLGYDGYQTCAVEFKAVVRVTRVSWGQQRLRRQSNGLNSCMGLRPIPEGTSNWVLFYHCHFTSQMLVLIYFPCDTETCWLCTLPL